MFTFCSHHTQPVDWQKHSQQNKCNLEAFLLISLISTFTLETVKKDTSYQQHQEHTTWPIHPSKTNGCSLRFSFQNPSPLLVRRRAKIFLKNSQSFSCQWQWAIWKDPWKEKSSHIKNSAWSVCLISIAIWKLLCCIITWVDWNKLHTENCLLKSSWSYPNLYCSYLYLQH